MNVGSTRVAQSLSVPRRRRFPFRPFVMGEEKSRVNGLSQTLVREDHVRDGVLSQSLTRVVYLIFKSGLHLPTRHRAKHYSDTKAILYLTTVPVRPPNYQHR
jgi:hypothetical protein